MISSHLILIATNDDDDTHFTDEKIKTQRGKIFAQSPRARKGESQDQIQALLIPEPL